MDAAVLPSPAFKDRKTGLIIFGLMTIFIGCACGLLVPLTILGTQMAPRTAQSPPPPNLLPVALFYAALAVVLVWLGIGSIKARRWARALLVIWSWSWLIAGLAAVAVLASMAPKFAALIQGAQPPGQPPLSGGARTAVMLIPLVMVVVLFVGLPLIWGLFYSGRNVRATCEARDPEVRWTDRCPLPVLAVSLWLAFGMLSMLAMPAFHSAAPFFGLFLSGVAGTVYYVCLAVVWGYCAWALYHLNPRGWWIILVALILFSVSNVITYSRHDITELYTLMGYPQSQVAEIQRMGVMGGRTMA